MKTAIAALVFLSGCASMPVGVTIKDDERQACAASQDCTVWTLDELRKLIAIALQRGFQAGQKRKGELSL